MFNYGETKKLKQTTDRLDRQQQSFDTCLLGMHKRVTDLEKNSAAAETVRWAVAEIGKLEQRVKGLETSTKPPMGLEPLQHGGPRFKGKAVPTSAAERIIRYLEGRGPVSYVAIAGDLGINPNTVATALMRAVRAGKVSRVSLGCYALPQSTYGGHASRYLEPARSIGQNGRG